MIVYVVVAIVSDALVVAAVGGGPTSWFVWETFLVAAKCEPAVSNHKLNSGLFVCEIACLQRQLSRLWRSAIPMRWPLPDRSSRPLLSINHELKPTITQDLALWELRPTPLDSTPCRK